MKRIVTFPSLIATTTCSKKIKGKKSGIRIFHLFNSWKEINQCRTTQDTGTNEELLYSLFYRYSII